MSLTACLSHAQVGVPFGGSFEDDDPELPLVSLANAKTLTPQLLAAAQEQYDKWDESDVDTYAGGGICHLIADDLVQVLSEGGITAASVSSSHEQHVYVVCQLEQGVYSLDIPHPTYERGGGFSWTKIQGVTFTPHHLVWYCVDRDPSNFDLQTEY